MGDLRLLEIKTRSPNTLCLLSLTDEPVKNKNFPELTDVSKLIEFMESLGSKLNGTKKRTVGNR